MGVKVAVASIDGTTVNQHFGNSRQFLIYDISDDGQFAYSELRETAPACGGGGHDADALLAKVKTISDCQAVLVTRIGPSAQQALALNGIRCYVIYEKIDKALRKLSDFLAGRSAF